jgi:hypothetical protein
MGAELERLLEGHPDGGGVTAFGGFGPEHDDVDAAMGLAGRAQVARDAAGGVFAVPGFGPGTGAGFKGGDDFVGDARVDVGAQFGFDGHEMLLRCVVVLFGSEGKSREAPRRSPSGRASSRRPRGKRQRR